MCRRRFRPRGSAWSRRGAMIEAAQPAAAVRTRRKARPGAAAGNFPAAHFVSQSRAADGRTIASYDAVAFYDAGRSLPLEETE